MGVTKTDFVRGLQCPKMLWLDSHKPEEKIIPEAVRRRLDLGNEFGDKAMSIFGDYVEATVYRPDGRLDYAAMIEKTRRCLLAGTPVVCEAAFSLYGNYCAADILKKTSYGYELYEVKNASLPRKEFLVDLGFQSYLIRKSGVPLERCFLILRGENEAEAEEDGENSKTTFKIVDETREARIFERVAEKNIRTFSNLKRKEAEEPKISVGKQCEEPYKCWYYGYCHSGEYGTET